ncbi:pollen-specific leucine-rich repeat extensin-like protein 4 [Iris pallida]|uniref:Pollen-specific leucine-rich repeat extensin-like protein 4 n=1 Tax=Iris pallida TaxID=29817 RepID=A0AAX6HVC9_IRIPA|nr:pollen-specific leucine-rich repeat extensin-like protein 4 [Iris pallida]
MAGRHSTLPIGARRRKTPEGGQLPMGGASGGQLGETVVDGTRRLAEVGIGRFGMGSRRRQWNRSRRRHAGSRSGGTKEPDRPVTRAPARRGRAVGIRGRRRRWLEPSGRSSWLAVGW